MEGEVLEDVVEEEEEVELLEANSEFLTSRSVSWEAGWWRLCVMLSILSCV